MAPIERATLRLIVYYEFLQGRSARAAADNICAAFKGNVVHYSTDLQDEYGNGPYSERATITVQVVDVQDTPPRFFFFDSYVNIEEDYGSNTTDEVVARFSASDGDITPEIARTISYSISGGNGDGYFKIDPPTDGSDTAKLRRAKTIDSEAPNTTFITLNITATELFENGTETDQSTSQTCVVSVADIDDNDPMFNFDHFTSEVDEDISYGVPLSFKSPGGEETFINVTDADATMQNRQFQLKIVDIGGGPPASQAFRLSPSGMVPGETIVTLTVNDPSLLDYEIEEYEEYIIPIAVEDVNGVAKNTATVTVKVKPKNDNFPQWSDPPYEGDTVVNENAPSGTEILTLKATDADRENGGTLWYYLSDRSFTGKELFSVDLETGKLSVANAANVDWETFGSNLIIYVVASDEADGQLGSHRNETSISITILDVNDNPPVFSIQEISGTENTKENGTLSGLLTVNDVDQPGTNNTAMDFEIKSIICQSNCVNPGASMDLVKLEIEPTNETTTSKYNIKFVANMDFTRQRGRWTIEILATDKGDPPLSTTQICYLNIEDVNDEGPNITKPEMDGYTFNVIESLEVGSPIIDSNTGQEFYIEATDNDLGENAAIEFIILDDIEYQYYELVDRGYGKTSFKLKQKLNRTISANYTAKIRARDKGQPSMSNDRSFTIFIEDVDEDPPVFKEFEGTHGINENTNGNVGSIPEAVDPDGMDIIVAYFIHGANTGDFKVNNQTRALTVEKPEGFDREETPTVNVTICATSTTTNSHCSGESLYKAIINFIDVNDEPAYFESKQDSSSVTSDNNANDVIKQFPLHDPDLNPTYNCRIEGPVTNDDTSLSGIGEPFVVTTSQDRSTCELILNFQPSTSHKGQFLLTLMVNDTKDPANLDGDGTMEVTIRMISTTDRIEFQFQNTVQEVTDKLNQIPTVFKNVLGYICVIDGAPKPSVGPDSQTMEKQTSIFTHFLYDDSANSSISVRASVVPGSEILRALEDPDTANELMVEFQKEDLILSSLSSDDGSKPKNELEIFVWALVGVSAVLLVLLLAASFVYFVKFSHESSGDSVLIGVEEEPEFKGYTFKPELQGSVGPKKRRAPSPPMKNPPPTPPEYSDDDMSPIDMTGESSGDSVLIGVEEEPEFKGYTFKPELQGSVGPKKRRAPSPPMKNPPPTPPEYSDDDMSPIDMTGFGDSAVKSNPLFGANL
ncbi:unnamed protein product [Darwinula stevensoni]|uniref:Cadherin domain-containing protein n=1 Tax=Darwinula stevensoni TaxID=69355 RepID=A0A7R9A373_9CRUS|nr:unnamed protein product [Darwinula stevensoni]CAG0881524.1 unnamed protein product [Darwinula stevensoni]